MTILYGVIIVATIYRLVSLEEFILWKSDCINSIYNSIQNEGLFIPENIHKNYKDNIPKGLSFFYKLEQIFTGSLYQPNSYCIISLTIPDEILKKYAVVGHYFGYISNGMKTAYEYLLPKEILEEYINSFRIICDSDLLLGDLMKEFRIQDDAKSSIRRFAEWPERYLALYNSTNQGDLEWLLEQFFGTKFITIMNGLLYPSENYILNNIEKFDFTDKNIGHSILKEAINDPLYYNIGKPSDQFIIPHPDSSVFGYIGKCLLQQEYETIKELCGKKNEILEYYIEGANQLFNSVYESSKLLQRHKSLKL